MSFKITFARNTCPALVNTSVNAEPSISSLEQSADCTALCALVRGTWKGPAPISVAGSSQTLQGHYKEQARSSTYTSLAFPWCNAAPLGGPQQQELKLGALDF